MLDTSSVFRGPAQPVPNLQSIQIHIFALVTILTRVSQALD
jgi:hypothetical protein